MNNQIAIPVMVKQPCDFCGNSPPYMCSSCNKWDDTVTLFEPHGERRSINGTIPADYWFA